MKRYDIDGDAYMREYHEGAFLRYGEWVKYDDAHAIELERDQLLARVRELESKLSEMSDAYDDLEKEYSDYVDTHQEL